MTPIISKVYVLYIANRDSGYIYLLGVFKTEDEALLNWAKYYINLQFFATQTLTDLNFYLNIKNSPFIIYKNSLFFKTNITKLFNTKFKYWLDDYYNGDKDNYSQNSTVLTECSKLLRLNTTSFF